MKNKIITIFVFMLLIATCVLSATGSINENITWENKVFENQTSMEFVPGEVIVKLKKDATLLRSSLNSLNEKNQVYAFEKVFLNAEGTIERISDPMGI